MAGSKPVRADARRNRERLLAAASAAFATEGLSVPLDEIAVRAGVGPGTLYRNFPSKEALLEAVLQDRLQRLAEDCEALCHAEDPAGALLSFIGQLVAQAAPKRDLVEALGIGGADLNATLAASTTRLRNGIGQLLARAQRTGAIRSDITAADLMALISSVLAALGSGAHRQADPGRVVAVLSDGLRPGP
ncbi:MAG: TetR/AcrR family transcriptional regulator [Nocardiopsaceae bacterium]|jgi:AcrR family transcriptional regulator|nr:TetR/AcrR family transcriptional regulator [Nocardiopsaceae bacterium]